MSVCSNGKMFVTDRSNNRVLVYNRVPTANGTVADFVIGQPDFSMNTAVTTANGFRTWWTRTHTPESPAGGDRGG